MAPEVGGDDDARVDRFLSAFNAVDVLLRERMGLHDHGMAFRTVLRRFLRGPTWKGAERLEAFADLRNLLVHETVTPNGWLAVPTEATVRRLEAIRDRLAGGRRADEAFSRPVETLAAATPLAEVLATAHRTGFSQFPVLDGGAVVGLLTDRGLARWWAAHAAGEGASSGTAIDSAGAAGATAVGATAAGATAAGATAADVLAADADRRTWATAAGNETAERVLARFVDAPTLEAVVITDGGRPDGALLGIATHLDVVRFWDEG